MEIVAKMDLTSASGSLDFIKGKSYTVTREGYQWAKGQPNEEMKVIDETGTEHRLGLWARHFKIATNG
jgi:hypothetical protein